MAATLVQTATPTSISGNGTGNLAVTINGTVSGNLIVATVVYTTVNGAGPFTPNTPAGFSVAVAPSSTWDSSFAACGANIFYQISAGGSVTCTATIPSGPTGWNGTMYVQEWSPFVAAPGDASGVFSANLGSTGTGGTPTTGALAQSNELVIAAVCLFGNTGLANAGISDPPASGYTSFAVHQATNVNFDPGYEMAYKDASSAAAQSAAYTWTADANMYGAQAVIATFKEYGGILFGQACM